VTAQRKPAGWLRGVLSGAEHTIAPHHGVGRAGHLSLDGEPLNDPTYVFEDAPPVTLDERKRDIKSRTANLQALESARHRLITKHNEDLADIEGQIATEAGDLQRERQALIAELASIGINAV
jgi:hypothetical protein